MKQAITQTVLEEQTRNYRGSGGISAENRSLGFRPAFLDTETGIVYPSRFMNGNPAPFHLLDGLPGELACLRTADGRVAKVKASVIAGFVRDDRFYSRDEAAQQAGLESACRSAEAA